MSEKNNNTKIPFQISVAWLLEIATKSEIEFTNYMKNQAKDCLKQHGYADELKKAETERINELRRKLHYVVGNDGMKKLDEALDTAKTAIKFAHKMNDSEIQ